MSLRPCPPILSILTQWQTFKLYGPYQYFLENIQLMVRPGGLGPWNLPIYHETLPETKSHSTCWRWLFIWVSPYLQGRIIARFKGAGSWTIWNPWAWRSLDVANASCRQDFNNGCLQPIDSPFRAAMDERHDRHEQRQTPNHGEEEVDSWAENSEEWKKISKHIGWALVD